MNKILSIIYCFIDSCPEPKEETLWFAPGWSWSLENNSESKIPRKKRRTGKKEDFKASKTKHSVFTLGCFPCNQTIIQMNTTLLPSKVNYSEKFVIDEPLKGSGLTVPQTKTPGDHWSLLKKNAGWWSVPHLGEKWFSVLLVIHILIRFAPVTSNESSDIFCSRWLCSNYCANPCGQHWL